MTTFNKETPVRDLSMKSFASSNEDLTPVFDEEINEKENDFPLSWDIEFNEILKKYNENILNPNPLYNSLVTRNKVLVRVFVNELTITPDGIVIPNTQRVVLPTKAGYGSIGTVESPYPYSSKAVIIAVPKYIEDLVPGMIVQLSEEPTRAVPMGGGNEAAITIPNKFTHYSYKSQEPPIDPMNPHYGYLLVDARFIDIILG